MNKESPQVHFVADDEQACSPLPRFVTRTTLKALLDGEPLNEASLELYAPGVDAPGVGAPGVDPAAAPTAN